MSRPKAKKTPAASPGRRTKRTAGRPRIEFDLAAVEGLGQIGATAAEMSCVLPASRSTIEHRMADRESDFSKAYQKGLGLLKTSLRRKQVQIAMSGNTTMLIWLGKQLLEQRDKHEVGGPEKGPIYMALEESMKMTDTEKARKVLAAAREGRSVHWDE